MLKTAVIMILDLLDFTWLFFLLSLSKLLECPLHWQYVLTPCFTVGLFKIHHSRCLEHCINLAVCALQSWEFFLMIYSFSFCLSCTCWIDPLIFLHLRSYFTLSLFLSYSLENFFDSVFRPTYEMFHFHHSCNFWELFLLLQCCPCLEQLVVFVDIIPFLRLWGYYSVAEVLLFCLHVISSECLILLVCLVWSLSEELFCKVWGSLARSDSYLWMRHQKSRVDTLCNGRSVLMEGFTLQWREGSPNVRIWVSVYLFGFSKERFSSLRKTYIFGLQYLGKQQDQGWWPSPYSVCGPSGNFNFSGKGTLPRRGNKGSTPTLSAAWCFHFLSLSRGGAGLMAGACISSAFYWVRTHLCQNFLLFKKNIDFSCLLLPLILFILYGLYLPPCVIFITLRN